MQATAFTGNACETIQLTVRLEEQKVVGRKRFFRTARCHLASFNMSPPNVRCVRGGFAWAHDPPSNAALVGDAKQAISEGKVARLKPG